MKKFLSKKKLVILLSVILVIVLCTVSVLVHLNSNSANKLSDISPDLLKDGIEGKVKWISTEIKTPNSFVSTAKDSQNIKKALSELEISTNPVSDDKSLNRDKTVSIAFEEMTDDYSTHAYSEIIYFNADFTEVWIYNEGIPTYTYKVINPEKVKAIIEKDYEGDYDISETSLVSEVFPDLTDEEKHRYLTLTTHITDYYEKYNEYLGLIYEDLLNLKIGTSPINNELYDKSEAVSVIELAFNLANDYYSPEYKYEFCFNKDKTELWVMENDKKGYKYKVYEPQKVEKFLDITNYNFFTLPDFDETLDKLYTHKESIKNIILSFEANLLPELGSEMFEDYPNSRKVYKLNKYDGVLYRENDTVIKLIEISYGSIEYVNLTIAIENSIPENGEVLYGKFLEFKEVDKLRKLQKSCDIICGDAIYEDAFEIYMASTLDFDVSISKEIYQKLEGNIKIEIPLLSMELKSK